MTFLHYFSPCLTINFDIASSIIIHEGIFSSWCSQGNHILQSRSRFPDTCIETLFYLTTVVSHFTISLLHLRIPLPHYTKLVCYVWSESVSQKKTLPASSFNVMSKTLTSTAIYRSKPYGPQANVIAVSAILPVVTLNSMKEALTWAVRQNNISCISFQFLPRYIPLSWIPTGFQQ